MAAPRLLDLARYLHDAPEAAFAQLTDICSVALLVSFSASIQSLTSLRLLSQEPHLIWVS